MPFWAPRSWVWVSIRIGARPVTSCITSHGGSMVFQDLPKVVIGQVLARMAKAAR